MEEKKKQFSIGGMWVKQNEKGKYYSMQIEVAGEKFNCVAYPNDYKEPGSKQPDFKIFPFRDKGGNKTETKKPVAKKKVIAPPPVIDDPDSEIP